MTYVRAFFFSTLSFSSQYSFFQYWANSARIFFEIFRCPSSLLDLDGKIDDKKPHVMDTSEFWHVTKNKVGYRLREILSGKSKTVREKDLEGKDVVVKAYVFNLEKLRRVAKKYGYEIVTKLPSEPSSEGMQASNSIVKHHEKNVEKSVDAPQQLGKLSYSVTTCWLCHELLPEDLRDCTVEDGKTCHIECLKSLRAGRTD